MSKVSTTTTERLEPDPDRAKRVRELFDEASELHGGSRTQFLARLKLEEPDLHPEVDELVRLSEAESPFFDSGARNLAGIIIGRDKDETLPRKMGKFELQRVLGEGGMGVVYLASEEFPKRTVALKLVRPEVTTPALVRRLSHEASALSLVRHPCIAQLYEAGFVDDRFGRRVPYLAMEFVDGPSLSDYIKNKQLPLRDKLNLMALLCDGVDHAHRRGVVHRDLKPGNVFVSSDGNPKILDFGIARLTEDADQGSFTGSGFIVGTIAYMSPEQLSGEAHLIDSRCDVYALGVMLYETLTGELPIDVKSMGVAAAAAKVRTVDPKLLGTFDRNMRGDVESIVAKALEKDPRKRYQSAAELASDIRRYLNDEPVTASKQTALYQVSKLVRRNKLATLGACIVVASVLGGAGVAWWKGNEAQKSAKTAANIGGFLKDVLTSPSPEVTRGRDMSALALLQTQGDSIDTRFADDLATRRELHAVMGKTLYSLGEDSKAEQHYAKAVELADTSTRIGRRTASMWNVERAKALQRLDRWEESEPMLQEALKYSTEEYGSASPETAYVEVWLGSVLTRRCHFKDAKIQLERALDTLTKTVGESDPRTAAAWARYAERMWYENPDWQDAIRNTEKAAEVCRHVLGDDHPDTLMCRWFAADVKAKGLIYRKLPLPYTIDEALTEFERCAHSLTNVLGKDHPETLRCLQSEQKILRAAGKYDRAIDNCRQLLEASDRALGRTHVQSILANSTLSMALLDAARYEEAEQCTRDSLARCAARDKPTYLEFDARLYLGSILLAKRDWTAARDAYVSSVTFAVHTRKGSLERSGQSLLNAAICAMELRDYAEATEFFEDGLSCFCDLDAKATGPLTTKIVEKYLPVLDENAPDLAARVRTAFDVAYKRTNDERVALGNTLAKYATNEAKDVPPYKDDLTKPHSK
ncbi:MAG: serine/threonine-protein kinase [Phycisphaerales bacterium]